MNDLGWISEKKVALSWIVLILFCLLEGRIQTLSAVTQTSIVKGGWYNWDPYQYLGEKKTLTGFDLELQKIIFKKMGYDIEIKVIPWKEHLEALKTGALDYAMGAFYSKERAHFSYVSIPYRFEENSLFRRRDSEKFHGMPGDITDFLQKIKKEHLKIGVVEGYRYANDVLNRFIDDPANATFIVKSKTDNRNLSLLLAGNLDGFLADRIVGATIAWREKVGSQIIEERLDSKAPIHMLLSKKSFTQKQVDEINMVIQKLKNSPEFTQIVSWYVYPTLLLATTDSPWFEVMQQIGIIAFAISGLSLAYRYNTSLFGTFILALLPSFGGGIMRDILLGRYPVFFLSANSYMMTLLLVVILGFFSIKLFDVIATRYPSTHFFGKRYRSPAFFDVVLAVTDALGLAVFTVTGILVSLIIKADPLWLWGPFFAFLTGAGGGILRDVILKQVKVEVLHGNPYAEITIVWGSCLSIYLTYTVYDVDPLKIQFSVMLTILLIFLTRIIVYAYDIPNLFFSSSRLSEREKVKDFK